MGDVVSASDTLFTLTFLRTGNDDRCMDQSMLPVGEDQDSLDLQMDTSVPRSSCLFPRQSEASTNRMGSDH